MYRGYDLILSFIIVTFIISLVIASFISSVNYRIAEVNRYANKKVAEYLAYTIANLIKTGYINVTDFMVKNITKISFDELNITKPVEFELPYRVFVVVDVYNVVQPIDLGRGGVLINKTWSFAIYTSPYTGTEYMLGACNSVITSNGYFILIRVYLY